MKHIWSVLCSKSIVDEQTNLISLFDCMEEIQVHFSGADKKNISVLKKDEKKNVPVNLEITSLWFSEEIKEDRKLEIKIGLYNPGNKNIAPILNEFTLPKEYKRLRTRIKINSIPFTISGEYNFDISFKERGQRNYTDATRIPLTIKIE